MKSEKSNLKAHLFVCTNTKANGPCCSAKGAQSLRDRLKRAVFEKHPEWKGQVRINNSGCLDRCENGIAAVLYPQGRWLTDLELVDEDKLIAALEEAMR